MLWCSVEHYCWQGLDRERVQNIAFLVAGLDVALIFTPNWRVNLLGEQVLPALCGVLVCSRSSQFRIRCYPARRFALMGVAFRGIVLGQSPISALKSGVLGCSAKGRLWRGVSHTGRAVLLTGDFNTNDECTPLTPSMRVSFCSRNSW